jgi:hypothetical protein
MRWIELRFHAANLQSSVSGCNLILAQNFIPFKPQHYQAPDTSLCRAILLESHGQIVYCLLEQARRCGFSLRMGSCFSCLHPHRKDIAARTKRKSGR